MAMLDVLPPTMINGHVLLQVWLSPSFPVGAFAYSHGLEKAVELGWVTNRSTLQAWLDDLNDVSTVAQMLNARFPSAHDAIDLGSPGIGREQDAQGLVHSVLGAR